MTGCPIRRESDEFACRCGLRWAADEERPPCPMQTEATMPELRQKLHGAGRAIPERKSFPILAEHYGDVDA